jgi:hypothetical protein
LPGTSERPTIETAFVKPGLKVMCHWSLNGEYYLYAVCNYKNHYLIIAFCFLVLNGVHVYCGGDLGSVIKATDIMFIAIGYWYVI